MKKVLIAVIAVVVLIAGLNAVHKTSKIYLENKQKTEFIQNATSYLEQKYGIKIADCIDYFPGDVSYHAPAFGIDGGYFTNSAMKGTFVDSTGKEIICVCRNGILSDDYEEYELFKNFYDYLSEKLGVDVKYVSFDNCGEEVVYTDGWDNYVDKDVYLFLEKSTKRYANMDADIFFKDLLDYFDGGNMNIYALENKATSRDMLMENTERFWNLTDLNGVYVNMYDENTDLGPDLDTDADSAKIANDGKILYKGIDGKYLFRENYYVICNSTGTRIQENDK